MTFFWNRAYRTKSYLSFCNVKAATIGGMQKIIVHSFRLRTNPLLKMKRRISFLSWLPDCFSGSILRRERAELRVKRVVYAVLML